MYPYHLTALCFIVGIGVTVFGLTSERRDEAQIVRNSVPDWWYRSFIVGIGCILILIGLLGLWP